MALLCGGLRRLREVGRRCFENSEQYPLRRQVRAKKADAWMVLVEKVENTENSSSGFDLEGDKEDI